MAFTRFHDDDCRVQKYLEETTGIGNYHLNVPGNGETPLFFNDIYIKPQKWGANLSNNKTDIESDLIKITNPLNRDNIVYTNYLTKNNVYNKKFSNIDNNEITCQSRATHPAWLYREINLFNENIDMSYKPNFNTKNVPNNFNYLHMDPQEHVSYQFNNNISTRIIEKDYYNFNNTYT